MKRILKSELDKFYTKEEIAKDLISKIDMNEYDLIIDPSCGDGAFYSNIKHDNKIAIDIEPGDIESIKMDYLKWVYDGSIKRDKILIITNPPFGKQGSLAMDFIKKSYDIADNIAMILPLSFTKVSVKNRLPEYLHLVYEEILDDDSFLLDGDNFPVKCVFQIWEKKSYKRNKYTTDKPKGFAYVNKSEFPDLSIRRVGVYAGKISLDVSKSEQSHYFIKVENKNKIDKLIEDLSKIEWVDRTVGPRSISKYELNKIINDILN
jgi:predicted RNA methylase